MHRITYSCVLLLYYSATFMYSTVHTVVYFYCTTQLHSCTVQYIQLCTSTVLLSYIHVQYSTYSCVLLLYYSATFMYSTVHTVVYFYCTTQLHSYTVQYIQLCTFYCTTQLHSCTVQYIQLCTSTVLLSYIHVQYSTYSCVLLLYYSATFIYSTVHTVVYFYCTSQLHSHTVQYIQLCTSTVLVSYIHIQYSTYSCVLLLYYSATFIYSTGKKPKVT